MGVPVVPSSSSWSSWRRPQFITALLACTLAAFFKPACSHGCMTNPNPRGSLTARTNFIRKTIDPSAPIDYFPHFPAGPRSNVKGSGIRHQKFNAGPRGWVPFQPLDKGFRWRAGVCGDSKQGPFEHQKGGVYYNKGEIVATYRKGSSITMELGINAHHNGFVAFHICDVSKCRNNEINEDCFRKGHCVALQRAWVDECQSGKSRNCGPIDRNHKERWYLPCYGHPDRSAVIRRYGSNGEIRYKLPSHLVCQHCVLHWYWTSANTCNPPGVVDYFDGPDKPNWGSCTGQGGARGGVARNQRACGGKNNPKWPEEYMQCADVQIKNSGGGGGKTPPAPVAPKPKKKKKIVAVTPKPKKKKKNNGGYNEEAGMRRGSKGVRDIILVDNGRRIASLNTLSRVRITSKSRFSIEALTESKIKQVSFKINGRFVNTDRKAPFYILGNRRNNQPYTWKPTPNQWVTISVSVAGDTDSVRIFFQK